MSSQHERFLWMTDPWPTLDHTRDTTLRLAEEACNIGAASWWSDVRTLRWRDGNAHLTAHRIERVKRARSSVTFYFGEQLITQIDYFDVIHYRVDPPVDPVYTQPLQILCCAMFQSKQPPEVANPLQTLFASSEKLETLLLDGLAPPTIVSSNVAALRRFGRCFGLTVLKPLNNIIGNGVRLLDWRTPGSSRRAATAIRALSRGQRTPVLLQQYLPSVMSDGEVRLWFVDGELLGSVRKRACRGKFPLNVSAGDKLEPVPCSSSALKLAPCIAAHLKARRIRLAAVDVIGGYVTDFNCLSPGLLVLMEDVLGRNLAREAVEALVTHTNDVVWQ